MELIHEIVFVLFNPAAGARKLHSHIAVPHSQVIERCLYRFGVVVDDWVAARRLITGGNEGIHGQRIQIRRRHCLLDEAAQYTGFFCGEVHNSDANGAGLAMSGNPGIVNEKHLGEIPRLTVEMRNIGWVRYGDPSHNEPAEAEHSM